MVSRYGMERRDEQAGCAPAATSTPLSEESKSLGLTQGSPPPVAILRRLAIASDMLQRRRDPVRAGRRPCSALLAPFGRDHALE